MPLGAALQFMLPRWVAVRLARIAAWFQYHLNPRLRLALLENYRHILNGQGHREHVASVRRALVHLMIKNVDLLRTPVLKRRVVHLVDFNPSMLDNLLDGGRAGVLISAHLGNWDLAGIFLAARGHRLSAVVEEISAGWTDSFDRFRRATSMETIRSYGRRAMVNAVRRGRWLTLVADRDVTGHGLSCPSFDSNRLFPKGPAAYALWYGLPMVFLCLVFQDVPGRPPYRVVIEELPRFTATDDPRNDIRDHTRAIAVKLNEHIHHYADQWLVSEAGWH